MFPMILCIYCVNFKDSNTGIVRCEAFPNGIPKDIILGFDHHKPYPGDNGIQFEPKEK